MASISNKPSQIRLIGLLALAVLAYGLCAIFSLFSIYYVGLGFAMGATFPLWSVLLVVGLPTGTWKVGKMAMAKRRLFMHSESDPNA
jgi:uncharacterized membrane protein YqjE